MAGLLDTLLGSPTASNTGTSDRLAGLLGSPALNVGLGLLASRYDRRINPAVASLHGLMSAQQQQQAYLDEQEKQRQLKAREHLQAIMGGLLDPSRQGDPTQQFAMQAAQNVPDGAGGFQAPAPQPPPASLLDPQTRQVLGALSAVDPNAAAAGYISSANAQQNAGSLGRDASRIQYWNQFQQLQQQERQGLVRPGTADKFFNSTLTTPALHYDPLTGGYAYLPMGAGASGAGPTVGQNTAASAATATQAGLNETEKVNAEKQTLFETTYPDTVNAFDNHLAGLKSLREQMAALSTGPILGNIKAKLLSDYQAANASNASETLQTMGTLKNLGVSLTPMSENDRKVTFDTASQMTNNRDANLKIIDKAIKSLQRQRSQVMTLRAALYGGIKLKDYRPAETGPLGEVLATPVEGDGWSIAQ